MHSTLIITGASGALGSWFVRTWLSQQPESHVIALCRSEPAANGCLQDLPESSRSRLECRIADLTDAESLTALAASLPVIKRATAVHLAADVAWDKTFEEMQALNVEGAQLFCGFVRTLVREPHFIYVSTAFTPCEGWTYRNGYEESKAAAERGLRNAYGEQMPISVFSCSLVIGATRDGAISRFHGLYPLIRFINSFSPPFLVGNREGLFDLVPIDWVVDELIHLVSHCVAGGGARDVVASAGDARLPYEQVIRIIESRVDHARQAVGIAPLVPAPILRSRQWAFLKRSLVAWRPEGISTRDFRYFERLLQIYGVYAESDMVRPPLNVRCSAPSAEDFLPKAVDYWLAHAPDARISLDRLAAKSAAMSG
ncbi:dehydrogenase [Pseudomonas coronafaciens pv. porri]|uniref:Dehydrogenase n=1 Tax=Pseudomonas coronafaciens pv. porri TaxID=83964 RepID=A0ABR5JS14_9PSED|nr:SDR family oxidoreductase [Pseudomonas coronafaciens]KOP57084.1 dehydrogenase [Pseudomonas coronafaciens pv. porri]KOP60299.1 dehydrogenase [Pseudomonas coronafaciens pv. porri]KPY19575.1 Dehydrogenase domain-containing protein [Pseudomonas coronafaciens pv. porri]RMU83313.1 Dehydrogenase domain-containing protein [Pseudomonas coronafaciens pv. porri]RMW02720.1 putative dehydrogenase domain of multifunctional non-ribosomal peptide synthetase-related enzyme [Pseudomonas coronafaciens pv. por